MEGSLFSIQLRCFEIVGFHRDASSVKFPKLLRVFQVMRIVCIFLCLPAEFAFLAQNLTDVVAAAESVGASFTEIITLGKFITFYLTQEKFYALIDQVQKLSSDLNVEDTLSIKKVNQQDKTMSFLYLMSAILAGGGLSALPIILNVKNIYFYGADYNYEMPMRTLYPYDMNYFPVYHLHYFVYCSATFITVFISVAIDALFLGICLNLGGHLEALRESYDNDKPKFIRRHQKILELAEELKKLIKPIIFIQYLITSIVLCTLGFQLVVVDSFFKRVVTSVFGFAMTIQLFIYSYGGQFIMDKTISVADNFYQNDKDLVLIVARAQRPIIIEAGFYQATLPTFQAIMSSTASLITLLQSFLE